MSALIDRLHKLPRFFRFCFVGGFGFITDAGFLFLLIHLGLDKIGARLLSATLALHVTWLLNRLLTYPQHQRVSKGEWARYMSVNGAGFLLNLGVYAFAAAALKFHFLSAIILSSCVALLFNYFGNLHLVFAERNREPLLPKAVLPAFLLMTAVVLLLGLQQWMQWDQTKGIQPDSVDSWLRLHLVEKLYQTGDWYNHQIERANSPYGMSTPWTRPLDVFLLTGAYALSHFVAFKSALLLWAAVWGRLLYLACGAILLNMAWRLDASRNSFFFVALAGVLNPVAWSYFAPGNADHHSLLITTFLLAFYQAFRFAENPEGEKSRPLKLGVFCGLGIWISVEFWLPALLFIGWMGGAWCHHKLQARQLVQMSLSLFLTLLIALLVERHPSEYFLIQYDTLSIVHLSLAFGILTIALVLRWLDGFLKIALWRWLEALVLSAFLGIALLMIFPGLLQGPLAGISPEMKKYFLAGVLEMKPLSDTYPAYMAVCIIYGILPLPFLLTSFFSGGNKWLLSLIILLDIALTLLVLLAVRWGGYAIMIQTIACTAAIAFICEKWPPANRYLPSLMLLSLIGGFLALSAGGSAKTTGDGVLAGMDKCESELKRKIIRGDFSKGGELTLAAPADLGSYILFWTPHRIIASNYHRDEQGFLDQLHFYQSSDEEKAKQFIDSRHIDKLVLCATPAKRKIYPLLKWLGGDGITPPAWLQIDEKNSDRKIGLYIFAVDR